MSYRTTQAFSRKAATPPPLAFWDWKRFPVNDELTYRAMYEQQMPPWGAEEPAPYGGDRV